MKVNIDEYVTAKILTQDFFTFKTAKRFLENFCL